MGVKEWFEQMEAAGEADMPVITVGGRMLTPRDILNEINGPLGDQIKMQMGW